MLRRENERKGFRVFARVKSEKGKHGIPKGQTVRSRKGQDSKHWAQLKREQ